MVTPTQARAIIHEWMYASKPALETGSKAIDALRDLASQVESMQADVECYRWLRDLKCNSFSLSRDEDTSCNYMNADEWIDNHKEFYEYDDPEEIQRMRETNTIWCLQIYPNTPIGFNVWHASTIDAVINEARKQS